MTATPPRRWPANSDYVGSVHDLEWCFADPELRSGTIRPSVVIGIPECAAGQNAIVFPVDCGAHKYAVRCFTHPADDGQRRYEAYGEYTSGLYCPPLVSAGWLAQGIQTTTGWWPVVKMEWIEGRTLSEVVESALDDPQQLRALAEQWRETVRMLRNAKIAHGDLQHGNVLMDQKGALRLVDYDGMWIPALAEVPTHEVGHPNYQHPERIKTGYWDEHIDTFSAFVIYLSLRALAEEPALWEFHNGENLILRERDYQEPSLTPVWDRLRRSPSHDVSVLSGLLITACNTTVKIATDLDEILDTRHVPLGVAVDTKPKHWWEPGYDGTAAPARVDADLNAIWGDPAKAVEPEPENIVVDDRDHTRYQPFVHDDLNDYDDDESGFDWRFAVIAFLLVIALAAAAVVIFVAARG